MRMENLMELTLEREKAAGDGVAIAQKQAVDAEKEGRRLVVFVCTGNTCRSPMAAALFNAKYAGETMYARSCGLSADGSPISPNAVLALIHKGVRSTGDNDYLSHVSQNVSEEILQKAWIVVGITGRHAMELMMRYPAYASKINGMARDIADPYGGDLARYEACLEEIDAALADAFLPQDHTPEDEGPNDEPDGQN